MFAHTKKIKFPSKEVLYYYFNSLISWIEVNETTFVIFTIAILFAITLLVICICYLSCCFHETCRKMKRYLINKKIGNDGKSIFIDINWGNNFEYNKVDDIEEEKTTEYDDFEMGEIKT